MKTKQQIIASKIWELEEKIGTGTMGVLNLHDVENLKSFLSHSLEEVWEVGANAGAETTKIVDKLKEYNRGVDDGAKAGRSDTIKELREKIPEKKLVYERDCELAKNLGIVRMLAKLIGFNQCRTEILESLKLMEDKLK